MIAQTLIALCSCGAIALLAQPGRVRRWGFAIGLAGQPVWLWETWGHAQWGIALVALWFTAWYAWGVWTHFGRRTP